MSVLIVEGVDGFRVSGFLRAAAGPGPEAGVRAGAHDNAPQAGAEPAFVRLALEHLNNFLRRNSRTVDGCRVKAVKYRVFCAQPLDPGLKLVYVLGRTTTHPKPGLNLLSCAWRSST